MFAFEIYSILYKLLITISSFVSFDHHHLSARKSRSEFNSCMTFMMSMNFRSFGSSVPVPVTVAIGSRGAIGRFGTARIRFVLMTISVGSPRVMDIVPT